MVLHDAPIYKRNPYISTAEAIKSIKSSVTNGQDATSVADKPARYDPIQIVDGKERVGMSSAAMDFKQFIEKSVENHLKKGTPLIFPYGANK